jgi:microcystin-dependent protein
MDAETLYLLTATSSQIVPSGTLMEYAGGFGTATSGTLSSTGSTLTVSSVVNFSISGGVCVLTHAGTNYVVSYSGIGSSTTLTNCTIPASAGTVTVTSGDYLYAAPSGFLLCDGSAYSRTVYANLYSALGGTSSPYGQGDGSTTFNVPDLRGRVTVGADQGGARLSSSSYVTSPAIVGTNGGEQNHLLQASESGIPPNISTYVESGSHTHAINGTRYGGPGPYTAFDYTGNFAGGPSYVGLSGSAVTMGGENTTHTHGIPNTAAPSAHNNVQPYMVVNKIIKF